ncbi:arylsulfatase [Flammeovirgaceae bacterium SG7u.111]|nr:arylsulfatase [Flammeovirgaceae bacterium SG7u.132]WPO34730.1 arylsulfatase [Flammeovirgaceae bacterium SG7u.111]
MKNLLLFLIYIPILFSCSDQERNPEKATTRPNVILILTDDQGYGDLGIHGNESIHTPVLDKMAIDGVRMDRFYVSPLCAPTRASLLTGRYNLRTGTRWVSDGLENMRGEEITIGEVFNNAGYKTGCFGKWHNGAHFPYHPNQQGFDEFIGFCAGHWNNYFGTKLEKNGEPFSTKGFITDALTDEAISFIKENKNAPFLCYIPYNVPHSPFQVPDKYYDKYYNNLTAIEDEAERRKAAAVYGMCENMDENVGRIFTEVEKLGLSENTIIIYLTDNGPNGHRFNAGMKGIKGSVHEGGVRVPFFAQWKGHFPKGVKSGKLAAHIDVLPTLASLCQIDLPKGLVLDGKDISPLLMGKEEGWPDRIIFTQQSDRELDPFKKGALRNSRYRLVFEGNKGGELFDMLEDPREQHDLSEEKPGLLDSLKGEYLTWFADVSAEVYDLRSIPMGFEDQQKIVLPAHESNFEGGLKFKEGHGWAHDWLVNWTSTSDQLYWKVEVAAYGKYKAYISYTCPEENIGSQIQLTAGENKVVGKIIKPFDPSYYPSPDRISRKEVYEKDWETVELGEIEISPGVRQLTIRATEVPTSQVGEFKNLTLIKTE